MKGLKTLIIFIIVLLTGAYIYFYERKTPTTEERKEKEKKIFDFKSEEVKKFSLKKGEHLIIVCEKKDEKWQMVKPLKVKANKSEIERILSRLEFLESQRKLKEKIELGKFGLDNPKIEVIINLKDKSLILLLGDNCPVGGNMYAMLKNREEILVVRKGIFNDLDKKIEDFRDRQVVEVDKFKTSKLLIECGGEILECRKEDEKWHITNPIQARGDSEKIEEILDKLNDLKVEDFISEDPAEMEKYGLSSPRLTATVWEGDISRSVIFGTPEENKVYAKRKAFDSIYSVKEDIISALTKEPGDLRDMDILKFTQSNAKKLIVEKKKKKYICERDSEDNWKLTEPIDIEPDSSAIDDILWELSSLRAEKFVDDIEKLSRYGLDKPAIKITVEVEEKEKKEKEIYVLLVGKKTKEDTFYAKLLGEKEIYEISSSTVETLKKDLEKKPD